LQITVSTIATFTELTTSTSTTVTMATTTQTTIETTSPAPSHSTFPQTSQERCKKDQSCNTAHLLPTQDLYNSGREHLRDEDI
jgi:hypothetical protein